MDSKAITEAENAVKLAITNYRKKKREPSENLSTQEKEARTQALKELAVIKLDANLALAKACRGIPVHKLTVQKLQAYYELYKIKSGKSHNILIKNSITEKDIRVFELLERQNNDQLIPNVLINGEEIGYPGVYLKKLDTLSDQGAAIAASLGKMPKISCCQYLGGAGSDCVKHGIGSPNGGFYVLCKGNANEPNIEDEIWAESWVWNSQSGALCLDSAESKYLDKQDIITDMYRYFSHKICRNEIAGQRHITHINVGAQSGVSTKVAYKDYPAPLEHFIDYRGYTDAKSQFILANSDMPYLFYDRVKSAKFQNVIEQQSRAFFHAIFENPSPLKGSEPLKQAIAFALYGNNDNLLTLLESRAGERAEELQSLIRANRDYIEHLNKNEIDFDALKNGAYLNAMSQTGTSALHIAALACNEGVVRQLIKSGINLDIQDKYGNSALMILFETVIYKNKNEQGRLLARILIEAGANVDTKDKDENTLLITAVKNSDFDMVRYLVDYHKADIETFDGDMKTAIFWAAEKGFEDIFNYLLNKNAKTNLVSYANKDSLLLAAGRGGNQEIIKALLSRKDANVEYKNKFGRIALHWVARNPELLKAILALYPEDQKLNAIKIVDKNGQNVLHLAAKTPESIKAILELYPDDQKLEAVKLVDKKRRTVLHHAAKTHESLIAILALYPESQRWDAIMLPDKHRITAMQRALLYTPESLEVIIQLLPKEHRLRAFKAVDGSGQNILQLKADNPKFLKTILELLPEEQRLEAIVPQHSLDSRALHTAMKNLESLTVLLTLIPKKQRLKAINSGNNHLETILHFEVRNYDPLRLKTILSLIPEEQRLRAINAQNSSGETVLFNAAKKPEVLKAILALIPEEQRLEAIELTSYYHYPVLHYAAMNGHADSLAIILALYPENQRLAVFSEVFRMTDNPKYSIIDWAEKYPDAMKAIEALLPEEKNPNVIRNTDKIADNDYLNASVQPQTPSSKTEVNPNAFFKPVPPPYSEQQINERELDSKDDLDSGLRRN